MRSAHAELTQRMGAAMVVLLHGLCRSLSLYAANNEAVTRQLDNLERGLAGWFSKTGEALQLQVLDRECFVNGTLVKLDAGLYQRLRQLSAQLRGLGVGEVTFTRDVDRATIDAFAEDLVQGLRSGHPAFRAEGYNGLKLAALDGRAVASLRVDPDRLATWLYGSLLTLVRRLYEAHAAGRRPSLAPLRRAIQLVIDVSEQAAPVLRLLAATEPDAGRPEVTATRFAI